jgi:hypothetical protein
MSSWTMPVTNCADWRIRGRSSTNVSTVSVKRSISYHCDKKNRKKHDVSQTNCQNRYTN